MGFKVLDLSRTNITKLPDSVCELVNLTSLLINKCMKLRHVPSLKKLKALKRLELHDTTLEKMPQDMECLCNLRYLIMNRCGERKFPGGILPKLSHLEVFVSRPESRIHDRHTGKVPLQGSIPMRTQTYTQTYPNSIRVQRSINNKINFII